MAAAASTRTQPSEAAPAREPGCGRPSRRRWPESTPQRRALAAARIFSAVVGTPASHAGTVSSTSAAPGNRCAHRAMSRCTSSGSRYIEQGPGAVGSTRRVASILSPSHASSSNRARDDAQACLLAETVGGAAPSTPEGPRSARRTYLIVHVLQELSTRAALPESDDECRRAGRREEAADLVVAGAHSQRLPTADSSAAEAPASKG